MDKNIEIIYSYKGIEDAVKTSVHQYVESNLQTKMDTYFKKILTHDDARILITIHIEKNHAKKFDGVFSFNLDGKPLRYAREGNDSFRNLHDLVNHAFDHVKRELASSK